MVTDSSWVDPSIMTGVGGFLKGEKCRILHLPAFRRIKLSSHHCWTALAIVLGFSVESV